MGVAMSKFVIDRKLQLRKEDKLKGDVKDDLTRQKFYAEKVSDKFKAGRPDLRLGHLEFGPLEVELKYNVLPLHMLEDADDLDSGMTKLQWLNLRRMNEHGMPAVCLIYYEALGYFGVTTLLRDTLPPPTRRVTRVTKGGVIQGSELYTSAMEYLHGLGYTYPHTRNRG